MTNTQSIELKASTVFLREDGIMHFDIKQVDEFTAEDVNDILKVIAEIGQGRSFPNLVTFQNYIEISKEAKELSASRKETNIRLRMLSF
jgi:hypothetical protein